MVNWAGGGVEGEGLMKMQTLSLSYQYKHLFCFFIPAPLGTLPNLFMMLIWCCSLMLELPHFWVSPGIIFLRVLTPLLPPHPV